MQKLLPFSKNPLVASVLADIHRAGNWYTVTYEVLDPENTLNLAPKFQASGSELDRADRLWEKTCFELFIRPNSQKMYYEFNFSLQAKWNVFQFDQYRFPQPPNRTDDFLLHNMKWNGSRLILELESLVEIDQPDQLVDLEMSLTAILLEKSGDKHYLALAHAGDKPDFHLAKSFVLKR